MGHWAQITNVPRQVVCRQNYLYLLYLHTPETVAEAPFAWRKSIQLRSVGPSSSASSEDSILRFFLADPLASLKKSSKSVLGSGFCQAICQLLIWIAPSQFGLLRFKVLDQCHELEGCVLLLEVQSSWLNFSNQCSIIQRLRIDHEDCLDILGGVLGVVEVNLVTQLPPLNPQVHELLFGFCQSLSFSSKWWSAHSFQTVWPPWHQVDRAWDSCLRCFSMHEPDHESSCGWKIRSVSQSGIRPSHKHQIFWISSTKLVKVCKVFLGMHFSDQLVDARDHSGVCGAVVLPMAFRPEADS